MTVEDIRLAIYRWFAQHGTAPSIDEISALLGANKAEVQSAFIELSNNRHIVLNEAHEIVMAHPFSAVPLGFSVMGPKTLWWGGCSWDSFALPHLVEPGEPYLIATTCPNCTKALAWNVSSESPPQGSDLAHFLVPVKNMWEDVVHTCGNQRVFCSQTCIDGWLEKTGNDEGYVMDLQTLWRLASEWYEGRLERGYVRREPSVAKDYFRRVGLSGPFWGLG